jgi:hypothetical protein
MHWAISIVSIATLSKRGSFRPGATGVTNIVLSSLGVFTRWCLRKTAHSEPAVTMLRTTKRAGGNDCHRPFASSPTASKRRKSQRPSILADPVSLGAARALGMTLGGRSQCLADQPEHHAIVNYFFFPVTSSHFSPRSVLILSTFTQASSFIWTNNARAAA